MVLSSTCLLWQGDWNVWTMSEISFSFLHFGPLANWNVATCRSSNFLETLGEKWLRGKCKAETTIFVNFLKWKHILNKFISNEIIMCPHVIDGTKRAYGFVKQRSLFGNLG